MKQPCIASAELPGAAPLSTAVLRQFDVAGPRYTSYPTADRFIEAFGADEYAAALRERRDAGASAPPLSLYVHIPFCESLCYYCACNKVVTRHRERATQYLAYLARETRLQAAQLGRRAAVSQLHLGGGTPTFLSDAQLGELLAMLRESFDFIPGGEWSIEIDPRTVDATRLANLAALGFNRLSLGVQDFDPEVQKAVHRIQPAHQVFGLMADARALGFKSINIDLIYGLPKQTPENFARTVQEVIQLQPDRLSVFNYAHLPERFMPQRRINSQDLPNPAQKLAMLQGTIEQLTAAGYRYIGMDHFALPDDELAIAQEDATLQRNFQGYTTHGHCDLIGLGVSAISQIGDLYCQNSSDLSHYQNTLADGQLATSRGLLCNADDRLRRAVIQQLICHFNLLFTDIEQTFNIDFRGYFAPLWPQLQEMAADGLIELDSSHIKVLPAGRLLVRSVCMVFDAYLEGHNRQRFSRVI